jgi:hypothetical protein
VLSPLLQSIADFRVVPTGPASIVLALGDPRPRIREGRLFRFIESRSIVHDDYPAIIPAQEISFLPISSERSRVPRTNRRDRHDPDG